MVNSFCSVSDTKMFRERSRNNVVGHELRKEKYEPWIIKIADYSLNMNGVNDVCTVTNVKKC
jgi:hypothetical protein